MASNSPSTFSIDAVLRAICVASSDAWCFAPKDSTELTHCSQQFLQLFGLSHPLPATSGRKIAIADSELQNACRGFGLPEDWFSLQFSAAEPPASADGTVTTEHFTVTHRPVPDEHDQVIGKLLLFRADKARLEASIWQRAAEARKELSTLSVRETEILNLVSRGLTNKAVARQANISEKTVEKHRANIMRKLGLRSVADLIRRVTEASIIEATDYEPLTIPVRAATFEVAFQARGDKCRRRRAPPHESQPQAARRVATAAADLRRHRFSTTVVASSLFLVSRPLSSQRGLRGFVRDSNSSAVQQSGTAFKRRQENSARPAASTHSFVDRSSHRQDSALPAESVPRNKQCDPRLNTGRIEFEGRTVSENTLQAAHA